MIRISGATYSGMADKMQKKHRRQHIVIQDTANNRIFALSRTEDARKTN